MGGIEEGGIVEVGIEGVGGCCAGLFSEGELEDHHQPIVLVLCVCMCMC